jgi:DNA-directed RNA polymerase subunit M/transcription elongation factor TFIIS
MAKASPETDPNTLRIRCNSCGSMLRVPKAVAGRFINCPKCQKKTQVPQNQKEADEEARDYGVNKLAYDTSGQCRSCGSKMAKNAIVCVKCGFDYRTGKQAEVVDKTKLPADYPTWNSMFKSMGGDAATKGTLQVVASAATAQIVGGLLGGGITFAILWFVSDGVTTPPAWPWYVGLGIVAVTVFFASGMLQEALIETSSRGLYGRAISSGSVPVAALYHWAINIPAMLFPALLLFFGALNVQKKKEEEFNMMDPGLLDGAPMLEITLKEGSGVPALVVVGILTCFGMIYFYFGLVSYITDLSVNPVNIFRWIGRCIVDIPAWMGITLGLILLASLVPILMVLGGNALALPPTIVNLLAAMAGNLLGAYSIATSAHLVGQIAKRHL